MKALREKFGEGVRARKPWVSEQVTVYIYPFISTQRQDYTTVR
jgi:hypothetical protein